jgi:hypothetical protein
VGYFRFDTLAGQEALTEVYKYLCPLYNVPAVYDVLPARIRALRSKDQGWQNAGGVKRGNERSD